MGQVTVLHLAPHPDDEMIGGPATLLELADHGHRVLCLAVGLGRPAQQARRRAEVTEACERAGFELVVMEPPAAISSGDDHAAAEERIAGTVAALIADETPDIVFSPSPHDRHHGHEIVARAAGRALETLGDAAPRWWLWGLWGDLPFPTLITYFGEARLARILHALSAHACENDRNDYRKLVAGRARAASVLGPERVFGFGSPGSGAELAELATELVFRGGRWLRGAPRVLDGSVPLAEPTGTDLTAWVREPSLTTRFGAPGR